MRYRSRLRSRSAGSKGGGLGRSAGIGSDLRCAGGALGRLEVLLGAAFGSGHQLRRVDDERVAVDRQAVAVHAARRRAPRSTRRRCRTSSRDRGTRSGPTIRRTGSGSRGAGTSATARTAGAGVGDEQATGRHVGRGLGCEGADLPELDVRAGGGDGQRPQRLVGRPSGGDAEQRAAELPAVAEELASCGSHLVSPRARRTSGSTGR